LLGPVHGFRFIVGSLKALFPELQHLELKGISTNEVILPNPAALLVSRRRVLKLKSIKFVTDAGFEPSSVYYGQQHESPKLAGRRGLRHQLRIRLPRAGDLVDAPRVRVALRER